MARHPLALAATVGIAALLVSGCTMKQAATQSLTGPSGLGTTVSITVTPDVLTQDGASQSLVSITAFDQNGQAARNVTLRSEIEVGGATADFGSLSARTIVTDGNGKATIVYTAPPPVNGVATDTAIQIAVTPLGTDFANDLARRVTIRLVPPGVIGLPPSPLSVDFTAPSVAAGDPAVFTATISDPTSSNAVATSIAWNFGDGATGSGQTATHTFTTSGTYLVRVTVTDNLGRIATALHAVTVGVGTNPTASFFTSPSSPSVDTPINFNASASTAAAGHRIVEYRWDFGDGNGGTGATTTHAFAQTGTYTVMLRVTDDVGRQGTTTQSITVAAGNPTADFTFNPSAPHAGQSVSFDASPSVAATGRTIVSYAWIFDDGSSGTGKTVSHAYGVAGTYNVRLTVTDDQGKTGSVTKAVIVTP